MHYFGWQDVELAYFAPREFNHPDMMDRQVLLSLDELRRRCGFPIRVTSDARTDADIEAIYGPPETWPRWLTVAGSPHQRGLAVDVVPHAADKRELDRRRLRIVAEATHMWRAQQWPRLGLEVADRHIHLDQDTMLRRPRIWPGVSR